MTPRQFTEVALKILGVYSVVEGVSTIAQGISFFGFVGLFSKMQESISYILISSILLVFGWMFLRHSERILSIIFDRGEPFPQSPDRHFREWHTSLLAVCGGFLNVKVLPIYLSSTTSLMTLLFMEPTRSRGFTSDSLWAHLLFHGGFTLFEAGIFIGLLYGAKRLTGYILKIQDLQPT